MSPPVAVFDACILYPFHLRNILVQAAVDRVVDARWTDAIYDEWIRKLAFAKPAIPVARLETTRHLMNEAVSTAMVSGFEVHIAKVVLPDPNDRHVVAAAIAGGALTIVTWNVRDFPVKALKTFGLLIDTPDAFLSGLYDSYPDLLIASLANARRNLTKSRGSASDFIEILQDQRLVHLAERAKKHLAEI